MKTTNPWQRWNVFFLFFLFQSPGTQAIAVLDDLVTRRRLNDGHSHRDYLRLFRFVILILLVIPQALWAQQGQLETPTPDSFQSGVGLVRGWVCSASRVEIEVVELGFLQAVYGESRGDTQGACGDSNNGFSLQINWNELGEGTHTIRALADGVEIGHAQVVVATLGQTYLQGAQGDFTVSPFPKDGQQVRLQWQESRQSFVLTNGGTPASGGGSPHTEGRLEDPSPASFQSGIGLVRGWVCSANRVDVELDGRLAVQAVYGESRADTRGVCNDDNNGFSLQVNWNDVGDGAHSVRVLADGAEVGSATFTVVTLGLGSFPKGLSGDFVLNNFPQAGKQTGVRWQESQQNFVITGARSLPTDTGVSDAPLSPVNQRILVVAQDGSGQYTTLTDAEATTQPGDTIQVKNGSYREQLRLRHSGTRELPITYIAYPGHRPKLENAGIKIEASWLIIDGFEIVNAENGINLVTASSRGEYNNITIRNNYIHNSGFMGAFIASASDVLVENNTFERNGLGPANCTSELWNGQNYSHCHGIYLSNSSSACVAQVTNVTIRRNRFIGNSGSGIQTYSNCTDSNNHRDDLIENNLFVNNATGMYLWSISGSMIRNNTIVQLDWARPQINALAGLDLNGARDNLIANNVIYAPSMESVAIRTWYPMPNTWTNNAIFVKADARWAWELSYVPFSLADYQQKSKDAAPVVRTIVDDAVDAAGFADLAGDNYRLSAQSPLRNAGTNEYCPSVDGDGNPRPREAKCDIGVFEFQ